MNTEASAAREYLLLVDDDQDIREMLCDVLRLHGYDVTTAANGVEALAALKRSAVLPSVILLDLVMPIMDGWQFRVEQNRDPRLSDIPVVILSGQGALTEHATTLAVSEVLVKPIELKELLALVKRYRSANV